MINVQNKSDIDLSKSTVSLVFLFQKKPRVQTRVRIITELSKRLCFTFTNKTLGWMSDTLTRTRSVPLSSHQRENRGSGEEGGRQGDLDRGP